ncbi:MAG: NAD-binding protein [Methylococcales bacterium]|nr:NAD-binding protein [Methylococcales bacterium]
MFRYQSVFFLVLRRLRMPLILLIVILSVSVLGMTLVPGVPDEHGHPQYMSFFHALYFISYTATTIGFGEIPVDFSNQQRLWVVVCIYLSVVGWAYTLGAVFNLLSDRNLAQAFATQRFARTVRRLNEPFYLVCGYGETGRLVYDALDHLGHRVVVIELNEQRCGLVGLQNYAADVPALTADASDPETLRLAGLTHPHCAGVLALTDDDNANLAVAISARLLAPKLPALCRAVGRETTANMASFGTQHIINPFQKFADYLALALHTPAAWRLLTWLTGLPGTIIVEHRSPPRGAWILCGHGRFGRFIAEALDHEAVPLTIIDRASPDSDAHTWIVGDGTGADALTEAGIDQAVGIIACTDSDVDNLSTAVTARDLNPDLYVILRQNLYSNRPLFDAFESDLNMVPSQVIAHECLAILSTPLLVPFIAELKRRSNDWNMALMERLTEHLGVEVPRVWSETLDRTLAPALCRHLASGATVVIGQLLRDPRDWKRALPCTALLLKRAGNIQVLPSEDTPLKHGDTLLLIGRPEARAELELLLRNEFTLHYVLNGTELTRGWLLKKLFGATTTLP